MVKLPKPKIDRSQASSKIALSAMAATALVLGIHFASTGQPLLALLSVGGVAAWLVTSWYGKWEGWTDLGLGLITLLAFAGVRSGAGGSDRRR